MPVVYGVGVPFSQLPSPSPVRVRADVAVFGAVPPSAAAPVLGTAQLSQPPSPVITFKSISVLGMAFSKPYPPILNAVLGVVPPLKFRADRPNVAILAR